MLGSWRAPARCIALLVAILAGCASQTEAELRCNELAGSPYEKENEEKGKGIPFAKLQADAAIEACRRAVADNPSVMQNRYRLGRALFKANRDQEAAEALRVAADAGYPPAQAALAYYHFRAKDFAKTLEWANRAAAQNDPSAHSYLGHLYATGSGVAKDLVKAAEFHKKAAARGLPESQLALALAYETGDGVAKDAAEAARWVAKAADQGLPAAEYNMAYYFQNGIGVPRDMQKAVTFYRRAADQKDPWAHLQLGKLHTAGQGVPQDVEGALRHYRMAAADPRVAAEANKAIAELQRPQLPVGGLAESQRAALEAMLEGKPFNFTDETLMFTGGVGSVLVQDCGLPKSFGDRLELSQFVATVQTRAALGHDYSNPNVLEGIGKAFSGMAVFGSGVTFAKGFDCTGMLAEKIAAGILGAVRSNAQGQGGGPSRFVQSCAPRFSQPQCECLADVGMAVISNIHQMEYHRDIIARIIKGSPLVALTIPFRCGITNY
jgi:TPR repeat protein